MECRLVIELIGAYVDGELQAGDVDVLDVHVKSCNTCRSELAAQRQIASSLSVRAAASVPDALWPAIERGLDDRRDVAATPGAPVRMPGRRRSMALAAALAMAAGLGLYGLVWTTPQAGAATLNYGVLLDALPLDAPKAFRKFLVLYDGKVSSPVNAKRYAPKLNFNLPEVLPGGFRLDTVYTMRFGEHPGVAAKYVRDGEFLAAIFHRPVQREDFGTHRDRPCVVGEHRGHKVQVGQWTLVHLTDPTTCHCVLSTLDEVSELPAVMAAVAPDSPSHEDHPHTHHQH